MLLEYYQARRCAQYQFVKLQIEFPWDRLERSRVILTAEERVRIGSLKRECLNCFVCVSLDHLDYIVAAYVECFHSVRPHQGLGNMPIPERGKEQHIPEDTEPLGKVEGQERLGGMLKHYYRKAAQIRVCRQVPGIQDLVSWTRSVYA